MIIAVLDMILYAVTPSSPNNLIICILKIKITNPVEISLKKLGKPHFIILIAVETLKKLSSNLNVFLFPTKCIDKTNKLNVDDITVAIAAPFMPIFKGNTNI